MGRIATFEGPSEVIFILYGFSLLSTNLVRNGPNAFIAATFEQNTQRAKLSTLLRNAQK